MLRHGEGHIQGCYIGERGNRGRAAEWTEYQEGVLIVPHPQSIKITKRVNAQKCSDPDRLVKCGNGKCIRGKNEIFKKGRGG